VGVLGWIGVGVVFVVVVLVALSIWHYPTDNSF